MYIVNVNAKVADFSYRISSYEIVVSEKILYNETKDWNYHVAFAITDGTTKTKPILSSLDNVMIALLSGVTYFAKR